MCRRCILDFNFYQELAQKTAVYPREYTVIYPALGLAGEAGEVANKVKKILRDSGGAVSEEVRIQLKAEIGDCLWYAAALCSDLGFDLEDVANENLEKLFDRKRRGTIRGSGDTR
jgi:NTP pyrophosphatase (non-canonical NTP hydrolase)